MIRIFTPSNADESNVNAQNLTVKEIVARLDPDRFFVQMIADEAPDPRIASRKNTELISWRRHGNAVRLLARSLLPPPDIYFYPRYSLVDAGFMLAREILGLDCALVTYVVMCVDENEPSDRSALWTRVRSAGVRHADAVFGNSEHVTETIRKYYSVLAETVHSGVDSRHFYPPATRQPGRPEQGRRPVILYVGSFQERKRPRWVIEQAGRLPWADFRLVGTGEEEAPCKNLAQSLNCGNVRFLGRLKPFEVGEEMRRADVFLFPSVLEGHPQVLMQAAACGLPCLAMERYRPDAVVHGVTGFLAKDDVELSGYLDALLNDPELRTRLSLAAIEHAKRFDWDQAAKRWAEIFESVVRRRRGGTA